MAAPRPPLTVVLRSALFWLVFGLATLLYGLFLGLFAWLLPRHWRFPFARTWALVNLAALKWICGLRWRFHGLDNVPAEPVIAFVKHQSTWETMALVKVLRSQVWVIKRELLRVPFFGWGIATLAPIAIDRAAGRAAVEQMVEQGRQCLEQGRSVIVFPEGTRIPPGRTVRYKMGGAVLAHRTQAPVLPIAHNAGEFWPRHSFAKWPGCIDLVVGTPIAVEGKTPEQINREAFDAIEQAMDEISGQGPAAG